MSESISVIGAGVAGLCVATELAARGAQVTMLDRAGPAGPHGCSWWAGGMLGPISESETTEEPVARLGQQAAGWWAQQGIEVRREGTIVMALGRDRRELDRFARRTTGHKTLDADAIASLEPDLAGRSAHALYLADEAHLDPRAALKTLTDALRARGVQLVAKEHVPPGPPGLSIDCRGLAARDVLDDLRGVKGEMVVLHCPELRLRRPVRLMHPRTPAYIVPRGDGFFMLGATQIEAAQRERVSVRSVLELLSAAYALHPTFGEAEIVELGCDARPAFPDNLPRIRRRGSTVFVNGLFRHGFLLAPALARMTADLVLEGITPEVMDEDHG